MPSFATRGFSLYYETHGQGTGVPLLLIMGIGASSQGWLVLQVPELSRGRPNVIFDNRGAGRSTDPGEDFTTAEMADDVISLLDHLRIPRANVLGAFLGGMVAQEVALRHPDRVNSLTLVGTYARADAKRRMLLENWQEMIEHGVSREARLKARLLWTLHDLTFEQADIIDAMWRFYLRQDAVLEEKVVHRQIQACLRHDTVARLEQIQAPTLIVCGEQDLLAPIHLHRQLSNGIPHSRLVPIPGAGHLVAAEMAPRFNRLVERFLLEFD
jgi:pimeloyl-ACP methyl ester carboxylesterase